VPFKSKFRIESTAISVPYPPIADDIRNNRGYVDTRGRPDLAMNIAEGANSIALGHILSELAQPNSIIFSVGCDLGAHEEPTHVPLRRRHVAGGYIHFSSANYTQITSETYAAFANALVDDLRAVCGSNIWEVRLVGQPAQFCFPDEPHGISPTLQIWFFAAAEHPPAAAQSRERLIEAIRSTFKSDRALASFAALKF
jgi:hypothetical protein